MTNTEALKKVYEAAGGEADTLPAGVTNLDILNVIAVQLGGEAKGSNAEAIQEIADHYSGGGGGFSTCTVQFSVAQGQYLDIAVLSDNSRIVDATQITGAEGAATAVLSNGAAIARTLGDMVEVTGNATYSDGTVTITGDCAITVSGGAN